MLWLSFLSLFLSSSALKETGGLKENPFFPGHTYYENTPEKLDSDFLPGFQKTPMVFLLSYSILHCRPSSFLPFLPHRRGDMA